MFKTKFGRKFSSLVMAVCILFACSITANAQSVEVPPSNLYLVEVDENMFIIHSAFIHATNTTLSISNAGVATAFASLTGRPGTTTNVSITMTLQRRGFLGLIWSDVETWTTSANHHSATILRTHNVGSGTYRVRAVYTANTDTTTAFSANVSH